MPPATPSTRELVLAFGLAASCGRLGFDVSPDAMSPGDAPLPDSGIPATFGDVTPLDELNQLGADDEDPSLTADLLEIYFRSTRDGDGDIYRATRDAIDQPFGPPARVDELSSDSNDATPEVSADGLTMYLSSNRGTVNLDIWWSTRLARTEPWTPPARVTESVVAGAESGAVRDAAELNAVFARRELFDDNTDLFRALRAATTEPWGEFVRLEELATAAYEGDGALDPDGLGLLFASDREGSGGGLDLWQTSRAALDLPFETPTSISELATADNEEDPWISPDRRRLYFVRDTDGDKQIYSASR